MMKFKKIICDSEENESLCATLMPLGARETLPEDRVEESLHKYVMKAFLTLPFGAPLISVTRLESSRAGNACL